jgi:hypothetical protein
MDEHFSDEELRELSGLLQDFTLEAYPNPEREGCPGSPALREMAALPTPAAHTLFAHVSKCSPCLREMLDERRGMLSRRRRTRVVVVAAACIAAGLGITYVLTHKPTVDRTESARTPHVAPQPTPGWNEVALNYEDLSSARGMPDRNQRPGKEQRAPVKRDLLVISLPLGSDDGEYSVQIRKTSGESSAVKTYTGVAAISGGRTILRVNADLSDLQPGHYVLAFRHADASWRVAPLRLE